VSESYGLKPGDMLRIESVNTNPPEAVHGLKIRLDKAKGGDPILVMPRILAVTALLQEHLEKAIPDAARIEIDIEWPDGGRVKVEGKA
jgi:hypothetical protein